MSMYIEQAKKNQEVQDIEKKIQDLEHIKIIGPEMIKKFEKEQEQFPEQMEKLQFQINYITSVLLGYDEAMMVLTRRLATLLA